MRYIGSASTSTALIVLALIIGLPVAVIILLAVGQGQVLMWAAAAALGLAALLFVFGQLEPKVGPEMYPRPRFGGYRESHPPWFVVAFMTGGQINEMREFYVEMGREEAMKGRCPHCHQKLSQEEAE